MRRKLFSSVCQEDWCLVPRVPGRINKEFFRLDDWIKILREFSYLPMTAILPTA